MKFCFLITIGQNMLPYLITKINIWQKFRDFFDFEFRTTKNLKKGLRLMKQKIAFLYKQFLIVDVFYIRKKKLLNGSQFKKKNDFVSIFNIYFPAWKAYKTKEMG